MTDPYNQDVSAYLRGPSVGRAAQSSVSTHIGGLTGAGSYSDSDELHSSSMYWKYLFKRLAIEVIATTFYTFMILCANGIVGIPPVAASVVRGLAFAAILTTFASIETGFVNPVLTWCIWILGILPHAQTWAHFYVPIFFNIAQVVGTFCAVLLNFWFVPTSVSHGAPAPVVGASHGEIFGIEAILCLIFFSIYLWGVTHNAHMLTGRGADYEKVTGIEKKQADKQLKERLKMVTNTFFAIGGTLLAADLIGKGVSGAAFNFNYYFWPTLLAGNLTGAWWIYLTAPLVGGVAATAVCLLFNWLLGTGSPWPEHAIGTKHPNLQV